MWVVVKSMVPFWVPSIIRHLMFRVYPKRDSNFDNYHVLQVVTALATMLIITLLLLSPMVLKE